MKRIEKQGRFTESEVCKQALSQYRVENNPARAFLVENYREHPEGDVVTSDAYQRYESWCTENGYRPLASNSFSREIKRTFPTSERKRLTLPAGREWCYIGICEGAKM